VWGFSRAVPADLEALVELGVSASVIESPISDLKLNAIGVDREKMLDRIEKVERPEETNELLLNFFARAERTLPAGAEIASAEPQAA